MASDWTWWLRAVKSIIILSLDHSTWWMEQINLDSAVKDLQLDIKKWIPPQLCLSKWIPKSRGLTAIEIIPSLIFKPTLRRDASSEASGCSKVTSTESTGSGWSTSTRSFQQKWPTKMFVSSHCEFPVGSQDSTAPLKKSNHPHLHDFNILVRSLTARHRSQFHLTSDHW